MNGPRPAAPSPDHARHDRLRIAAAADHGATPDDVAAATDQLAACADCARLHADLVSIVVAIPTSAVPPRRREFTLTPADAERLRPSGLRRWLRLIGTSRDTVTRPLAIGFTTLGLAGMLLASAPALLPGAVSGPVLSSVGNSVQRVDATADPAPAASPHKGEATPGSDQGDDGGVFGGSDTGDTAGVLAASPPGDAGPEAALTDELNVRDDASGLSTLVVVAGVLTIMGLGLFALRWTSRRFGD
ncbi:hypothetical protein BH20CHL7_BH20CHL7_14780 [soil metagenome]